MESLNISNVDTTFLATNLAPIFLTGFSGTGKSTQGQALAHLTGRTFYDLDSEIELLSGQKIEDIIREQGEMVFRQKEMQILFTLSLTQKSIIALGGGSLLLPQNLERVRAARGCLIYLSSSLPRLLENLQAQRLLRPLIGEPTHERVEHLFAQRQASYLKADIIFSMDTLTIPEASQEIYKAYVKWLKNSTLN